MVVQPFIRCSSGGILTKLPDLTGFLESLHWNPHTHFSSHAPPLPLAHCQNRGSWSAVPAHAPGTPRFYRSTKVPRAVSLTQARFLHPQYDDKASSSPLLLFNILLNRIIQKTLSLIIIRLIWIGLWICMCLYSFQKFIVFPFRFWFQNLRVPWLRFCFVSGHVCVFCGK